MLCVHFIIIIIIIKCWCTENYIWKCFDHVSVSCQCILHMEIKKTCHFMLSSRFVWTVGFTFIILDLDLKIKKLFILDTALITLHMCVSFQVLPVQ